MYTTEQDFMITIHPEPLLYLYERLAIKKYKYDI